MFDSNKVNRRQAIAASIATMAPSLAFSQTESAWPHRQVKFVIPWPPGGPVDYYGRLFANAFAQAIGQSVVVDNRSGAGGLIGVDYVTKAPGDGYTLLLANSPALIGNAVEGANVIRYDPRADWKPIGIFQETHSMIFASAGSGIRDMRSFIESSKNKNREFAYASSGIGTQGSKAMRAIQDKYGIQLLEVPYRGGAQRLNSVVANETQLGLFDINIAKPHVKAGKLFPVLNTTRARDADWPQIPTLAELEITQLDLSNFHVLLAPRSTGEPLFRTLVHAFEKVANDRAFQQLITGDGSTGVNLTGQRAVARIDEAFEQARENKA